MTSSRALCCFPLVKKEKHDFIFFVQCIIKQLLDSVFVGKGYQSQPSASADNPYLYLEYSGYLKNLIQ